MDIHKVIQELSKGGQSRSPAKLAAISENAKLGGRKRTRFELVIWGKPANAPRYKRYHDTVEQAQAEGNALRYKMQQEGLQVAAHPLIVYGPGLPKDGIRA